MGPSLDTNEADASSHHGPASSLPVPASDSPSSHDRKRRATDTALTSAEAVKREKKDVTNLCTDTGVVSPPSIKGLNSSTRTIDCYFGQSKGGGGPSEADAPACVSIPKPKSTAPSTAKPSQPELTKPLSSTSTRRPAVATTGGSLGPGDDQSVPQGADIVHSLLKENERLNAEVVSLEAKLKTVQTKERELQNEVASRRSLCEELTKDVELTRSREADKETRIRDLLVDMVRQIAK